MVTGRAGHGVGDQDQRGGTGLGHGRRTHDGLTRTARQYHHPRPAGPERVRRHLLVVPQFPAILRQADRVGLAIDVAGQIFGRPADLEQHLFDPAPLAGVNQDGVVIDARAQHRGDLLIAQHLREDRAVQTEQAEAVGGVLDQLESAVAGHGVDDVDQQRLGYRVAGEVHQYVDHLFGVVAGGTGVPQRQRGDAIGVDVFGGTFEFGERGDGGACGVGLLVVDLEKDCLVALHDQGAVSHGPIIRARPTSRR